MVQDPLEIVKGDIMKHFTLEEFNCQCGCGTQDMSTQFLKMLDNARGIANIPFVINSGYRCSEHNIAIGGSSTSSHLDGLAADIKTESSYHRFKIVQALIEVGFNRIGIGENFVHVDFDGTKTPYVMWDYYHK